MYSNTVTVTPLAPGKREHVTMPFGLFSSADFPQNVGYPTPPRLTQPSNFSVGEKFGQYTVVPGSYIGADPALQRNMASVSLYASDPDDPNSVREYVVWPGTYMADDLNQYGIIGSLKGFKTDELAKATFSLVKGTTSIRGPGSTGSFLNSGKEIAALVVEVCGEACQAVFPPSQTSSVEHLTGTPQANYFASSDISDSGASSNSGAGFSWFWIIFLIAILVGISLYLRNTHDVKTEVDASSKT
jgi:hypothetical protein